MILCIRDYNDRNKISPDLIFSHIKHVSISILLFFLPTQLAHKIVCTTKITFLHWKYNENLIMFSFSSISTTTVLNSLCSKLFWNIHATRYALSSLPDLPNSFSLGWYLSLTRWFSWTAITARAVMTVHCAGLTLGRQTNICLLGSKVALIQWRIFFFFCSTDMLHLCASLYKYKCPQLKLPSSPNLSFPAFLPPF